MSQAPTELVPQNLLDQEEALLYDAAAERGFLACLMQSPDLILEAQRMVKPQWLFHKQHRYAYGIMLYIAQTASSYGWQIGFDEFSVLSFAKQAGPQFAENFLRRTDGMANWHRLADAVPYIDKNQFAQYMATIRDRAARVAMFRKARLLQKSVQNFALHQDASQVAVEFEGYLSQIAFGSSDDNESRMQPLRDYMRPFFDKSMLNHAYPQMSLFHLRHPRFERWMEIMGGGFRRNSLTIIAARPKVGKSTLLLNIAMDFAKLEVPALFLDTEMSGEEQISRQLSSLTQIEEHALIAGKFLQEGTATDYGPILEAMNTIDRAKLFYCSISGRPIDYVLSMIRQFTAKHVGTETIIHPRTGKPITFTKPCVVVYDWLKIPSVGALDGGIAEYQALGDVATRLKDLAKKLNIPIIAGAQNNRNSVGKDEMDHVENAEAYVGGSDRLIQFCNTLCILRNPSIKMGEAIAQTDNWGHYRQDRDDSGSWLFNQILQITVQRQGRDYRYGLPMYIDRGRATYKEVSDLSGRQLDDHNRKYNQPDQKKEALGKAAMDFLRSFARASRQTSAVRKKKDEPAMPDPAAVAAAQPAPAVSAAA